MSDKWNDKSPWPWILAGCGGCLVVVVAVVIVAGVFTARMVHQVKEEMTDPVVRAERIGQILGAETLPEGYHAMFTFTVPWVVEIAILSDKPADDSGEPQVFDDRGFIYLNFIRIGEEEELRLDEFFAGELDGLDLLDQHDIHLRDAEILGRGELEIGGEPTRYVTLRGSLRLEGEHGDDRGRESFINVIRTECASSDRLRLAIWFAPDPQLEQTAEELGLAGSIADEETIATFLDHFRVCAAESDDDA